MKLVYICSPYAGDIEGKVGFAKRLSLCMRQGCAPVAVHLLYRRFLNDACHPCGKTDRMGLGYSHLRRTVGMRSAISFRDAAGNR
jgi:hypothetical protein